MKSRRVMWVAALGLGLVLTGCSSNCRVSCERYKECASANLDVDRCTQVCATKSEEDNGFQLRAEDCAVCVDNKTCAEANNRCWDECLPVVLAQP